jgi:hypothetical protein
LEAFDPQSIIIGSFESLSLRLPKVRAVTIKETNYAKALDQLVSLAETDWIFYIKENERILQINEDVAGLWQQDEIFGLQIVKDGILVKEARIWNKSKHISFKNPVFEVPNTTITKVADILLYQGEEKGNNEKLLDEWRRSQPLSVNACYYKAFSCLARKKFLDFKSLIINYLFATTKNDIPTVIARYYLALIQGIVTNETKEAIENTLLCLEANVLMAEFWCLLGDIFMKNNDYERAIAFYENGMMLGSRRSKFDLWPMEISKYETHPKEMIERCKGILSQIKTYKS